jgi:hypothetical protein
MGGLVADAGSLDGRYGLMDWAGYLDDGLSIRCGCVGRMAAFLGSVDGVRHGRLQVHSTT